jgi:3-keto steroid reductase
MLGSQNHTIHIYTAALAAVHLSLISLSFLATPHPWPTGSTANGDGHAKMSQPVRFKSETDRWGTERVGVVPVIGWDDYEEEGRQLLKECDKLYQQFWKTGGTPKSPS